MFEKNDKKRVYWLIDQYLSGKNDAKTFCDEFYFSYDRTIKRENLSALEIQVFDPLSEVAERFSEFEEDHRNCPKAFSSEKELVRKILETKYLLQSK